MSLCVCVYSLRLSLFVSLSLSPSGLNTGLVLRTMLQVKHSSDVQAHDLDNSHRAHNSANAKEFAFLEMAHLRSHSDV